MLSNKSELFVAVAEQEQEVVAGGGSPVIFGDYSNYNVVDSLKTKMTWAGGSGAGTVNIDKKLTLDSTALIGFKGVLPSYHPM